MPALRDTGGYTVYEDTSRFRLRSPGVERYARTKGGALRGLALGAAVLTALVGTMVVLWKLR